MSNFFLTLNKNIYNLWWNYLSSFILRSAERYMLTFTFFVSFEAYQYLFVNNIGLKKAEAVWLSSKARTKFMIYPSDTHHPLYTPANCNIFCSSNIIEKSWCVLQNATWTHFLQNINQRHISNNTECSHGLCS